MTASKILEIQVQIGKLQGLADAVKNMQSDLDKTASALQKITDETDKTGSILSKTIGKLGKGIKSFAGTIKKGVLGGLQASLKVARNLVMALGAAAAASLAVASGSIQRERISKDSKVTPSQLLAWQYAQEQTGLDENELNLANLQRHINDINSSGLFARLGLQRENLVGLSGIEAMQKMIEAVKKKGGANMTDSMWNAVGESISTLLGVDGLNRMHIFSDKTQDEFNKHYQWGVANGIDNDKLKKGEQALNKFQFTLKKLGMELAGDFLPHIAKGLEVFAKALLKIRNYLKGKEGQNIINQLGSLFSKVADFLGTVASLSLEGIGNYLLPTLNGIVGFLAKLANGDFKGAWGDLKSVGKAVADWAMNDAVPMAKVVGSKAWGKANEIGDNLIGKSISNGKADPNQWLKHLIAGGKTAQEIIAHARKRQLFVNKTDDEIRIKIRDTYQEMIPENIAMNHGGASTYFKPL